MPYVREYRNMSVAMLGCTPQTEKEGTVHTTTTLEGASPPQVIVKRSFRVQDQVAVAVHFMQNIKTFLPKFLCFDKKKVLVPHNALYRAIRNFALLFNSSRTVRDRFGTGPGAAGDVWRVWGGLGGQRPQEATVPYFST